MALTSYEPVCIEMPSREISNEQLYERVNEIVSRIPSYGNTNDGVVEHEDRVRVKITVREDGTALRGLNEAELTMTVGDGFFPQPLYEGMIGMSVGEHKNWEWNSLDYVDEEYRDADQAHAMDADVEVLSLNKRVKPSMTDEWVKNHIPRCSTVEEFLDQVRSQAQDDMDKQWETLKNERCKEALAQRLEDPPTSEEIERAVEGVRENFEKSLTLEGKLKTQKANELGIDEDQLDALLVQQGVMVAAQGKALDYVADHFDICVDDKDLQDAFSKNFANDSQAQEYLKSPAGMRALQKIARSEKALKFVVDNAVVRKEGGVQAQKAVPKYPNPFA